MALEDYHRKRSFSRTPEPAGTARARRSGWRFVVQKHAARRLHYDFRLEMDGVLKSWAVPKGPSLDPSERRLAVEVEDHPLEYGDFEGVIPAGEYGGGTVLLWDRGTWSMEGDPVEAHRKGRLKFRLFGEKLRGGWTLVRMPRKAGERSENWLLIKERDAEARRLDEFDVLEEEPVSAATGRTLGQVAADRNRTWRSRPAKKQVATAARGSSARAKKRTRSPAGLTGATAAPFPKFIQPQLAALATEPLSGEVWVHEIKFDGYRLVSYVNGGEVTLRTRNRLDWTARFPELASALQDLPVRQAVLDGEIVALLPSGISSFQELQNALSEGRTGQLVYYAFDLLYLDGYDLRKVPLIERKAKLAEILADAGGSSLQYTDHMEGRGPEFFEQCCRMGLEGMIAKRRDRPYRSGRNDDWLKVKCVEREEFVIGGFTEPAGSRKGLGALLVGYFDPQRRLVYAGRVGTGFSEQTLLELRGRLKALEQKESPFVNLSAREAGRGVHWVRPELVAQVEFSNWTGEGVLRHPSFQGLREDRPPSSIIRETPAAPAAKRAKSPGRKARPARSQADASASNGPTGLTQEQVSQLERVRLTNPNRVLYSGQGVTKLGLASYYASIADWVLPHVTGRPLSLVRCPEGQHKDCFYQKHAATGTPETIRRVMIEEKKKSEPYLVVDDLAGLLSLVQMGVLEIHPWGARADATERPDRMVFDLDPDPAVAWTRVIEAAYSIRERLEELRLVSLVKTTGGKGLHVIVPLQRRHDWSAVKQFSKAFAEQLVAEAPQKYTANPSKSARRGKIFLDYLRNDRGATAVAAYSTRALAGAPVSVPLAWDELSPAIRSDHFNVNNLPGRLASLDRDPWEQIGAVRQSITAAMRKRVGLRGRAAQFSSES